MNAETERELTRFVKRTAEHVLRLDREVEKRPTRVGVFVMLCGWELGQRIAEVLL